MQTLKGWEVVLVTSLLLYALTRRVLRSRLQSQRQLLAFSRRQVSSR